MNIVTSRNVIFRCALGMGVFERTSSLLFMTICGSSLVPLYFRQSRYISVRAITSPPSCRYSLFSIILQPVFTSSCRGQTFLKFPSQDFPSPTTCLSTEVQTFLYCFVPTVLYCPFHWEILVSRFHSPKRLRRSCDVMSVSVSFGFSIYFD